MVHLKDYKVLKVTLVFKDLLVLKVILVILVFKDLLDIPASKDLLAIPVSRVTPVFKVLLDSGFTGYTGFQGFTGSQGYTGFRGYTGFQGYTGYTGFQGFTGSQGYTGFQGFQGYTGYTGFPRIPGIYWLYRFRIPGIYRVCTGFQGFQGFTGRGFQGNTGFQGYTGFQGFQGRSGSFGGASFEFILDLSTTSSGDPGTSQIIFDNSTVTSSTNMYIDNTSNVDSATIDSFVATITSVTSDVKGFVKIYKKSDNTKFVTFQITSITDNTGWFSFSCFTPSIF